MARLRLTRLGAVLLGLLAAFIAANVVFWGFGLADHFSKQVQAKLFILDAACVGMFAMFLTGRTPYSMRMVLRDRVVPPSDDETVEKLSE